MASRAYKGQDTYGEPIITVDGGNVYAGAAFAGLPILTIRGQQIFGNASVSQIATVEGNSIYDDRNHQIATVEGNAVYEGAGSWGGASPIATIVDGGRMTGAAAAVFLLLM